MQHNKGHHVHPVRGCLFATTGCDKLKYLYACPRVRVAIASARQPPGDVPPELYPLKGQLGR